MKKILAILLSLLTLLSCGLLSACTQNSSAETSAEETTFAPAADGQNAEQTPAAAEPEKADLGLTAEVKPATDFTAKANAAVYDELDFDDKQPAMDLSRDKNAEEMKWSPLEMGAAMQAHGA